MKRTRPDCVANVATKRKISEDQRSLVVQVAGLAETETSTQPETYFVSPDNTVESHRVGNGAHMILSADLLYQINRKDGVFLSLPIVTLTGSSDYKIGLLSSRPALGLGYSRRVGDILFYLSILTAPYDKWDKELISRIQPNEPVFEKVDLSDYPSSKHHHLMTSVGFSIPLY